MRVLFDRELIALSIFLFRNKDNKFCQSFGNFDLCGIACDFIVFSEQILSVVYCCEANKVFFFIRNRAFGQGFNKELFLDTDFYFVGVYKQPSYYSEYVKNNEPEYQDNNDISHLFYSSSVSRSLCHY